MKDRFFNGLISSKLWYIAQFLGTGEERKKRIQKVRGRAQFLSLNNFILYAEVEFKS